MILNLRPLIQDTLSWVIAQLGSHNDQKTPQCCVCHSLIGHPVIIWVVFHDLGSMSLTLNKLLVRYVLEFEPGAEGNRRKMTQTQTVFLWSFPIFFRWVTFECKNREVLIQTAIKDMYMLRNIEKQHDCLICSTSRKNDYQVSRSHWKEQLKYG